MDIALIIVVITQFALLWHRMGRIEGMIERNNRRAAKNPEP